MALTKEQVSLGWKVGVGEEVGVNAGRVHNEKGLEVMGMKGLEVMGMKGLEVMGMMITGGAILG